MSETPGPARPGIPVYTLFDHNVYEGPDFHGIYPSPEAAKAYVAEYHGPIVNEWQERPTVEGQPNIHTLSMGHGFWQISQHALASDGTAAYDEAVLDAAAEVLHRRFALFTDDLINGLTRASAVVKSHPRLII